MNALSETSSSAVVTVVLIWKFKKLPEPVIMLIAAVVGLIVYPLVKS